MTTRSPVTFKETVDLACLPQEEYKDAHNARKGHWGPAPISDELWDGERRRFWERELTSEELKEIQRFRQKARYAAMFLGLNGILGLKVVHMPKVPPIILELVNLSMQQQQAAMNGQVMFDGSLPPSSPDVNMNNNTSTPDINNKKDENSSPTILSQSMKQPSYDAIYHAHVTEFFEYTNPISDVKIDGLVDSPSTNQQDFSSSTTTTNNNNNGTSENNPTKENNNTSSSSNNNNNKRTSLEKTSTSTTSNGGSDSPSMTQNKRDSAKRLSFSQQAAIKGAGKVLKIETTATGGSPRLGNAIHRSNSARRRAHSEELEKKRMKKRQQIHPILQPWYIVLYFVTPLFLLFTYYSIRWLSNDVYNAWTSNKAIKWAIEIPWIIERLMMVPDNSLLKSTVYVGLFAVEVTTLVYLALIIGSNVTIFLVIRPLLLSLLSSFGEYRGAKSA
jgi:hypothetical protein